MQSLVRAWVETTTGRLIRAEVRTRDARLGVLAAFDNVIRVDFRPDAKLGILVPYEMEERFLRRPLPRGHGHGAVFELPAVPHRAAAWCRRRPMKLAAAALAITMLAQAPTATGAARPPQPRI